jgi:hypothetical protein
LGCRACYCIESAFDRANKDDSERHFEGHYCKSPHPTP